MITHHFLENYLITKHLEIQNHSQSNTNPGYANFDWVTNENATDNTVKVKEAYWLYNKEKLFGADVPWGASVGRRPSTDGLPTNIKKMTKRKLSIISCS